MALGGSLPLLVHSQGETSSFLISVTRSLGRGSVLCSLQLLSQFGPSRRRPVEFNYILPIGNIQEMSL